MQRFGRFEVEEELSQGSMPWLSMRIWSFGEAKVIEELGQEKLQRSQITFGEVLFRVSSQGLLLI